MNKQRFIQQWEQFLNRKTKQYIPALYRVIRNQVKYWAETKDIAGIPIQPLYDVLKDIYTNTGRLWAWQTHQSIMAQVPRQTKAAPLGLNQEFINQILSYFNARLLERVDGITQTTREWIEQQIIEGQTDNLSLDQIVRNILANTDMPRYRAERISRTENMFAANHAEQIGADKTGLQTNKVWLSVNDNRTRHDHRLVDDQIRPDGEPFNVGGFLMQRPGDSGTQNNNGEVAPASEVVNCRCVVARRVLKDADGLPLRKGIVIGSVA